jgi:quercetin dioxygenase-like cupin family protein
MAHSGEVARRAAPEDPCSSFNEQGGHMPLVEVKGRLALALSIALVVLGAAVTTASAMVARDPQPAGPQGVHITPLSKGTIGASVHADAAGIEFTTHGRKDLLITAITVDPGGSFGWHSHPGPVLVALSRGTLTVFDATRRGCRRSTVTAGDAFAEDSHHVHLARNEGAVPVELNATFLTRPGTTEYLKTEPRQPGCPA